MAPYLRDLGQCDPGTRLAQLKRSSKPPAIRAAQLEALREELRSMVVRLGQLDALQRRPKEENMSTCDQTEITEQTEHSDASEEDELWQHIDRLEEQIVQARQTKISLSQALELYEEEMAELDYIHDNKQRFVAELSDQLQRKRKKIELNKSWSYEADKLQKTLEGATTYWRQSIRHFLG